MSLLAAIRQIFTETGATRISSKQLVEALRAIPLSASGGEGQGEVVRYSQLTQTTLGRHLSRFGIHSRTLRIGDRLAKGYALADFAPAFSRFLSDGKS